MWRYTCCCGLCAQVVCCGLVYPTSPTGVFPCDRQCFRLDLFSFKVCGQDFSTACYSSVVCRTPVL